MVFGLKLFVSVMHYQDLVADSFYGWKSTTKS